MLIVDFQHCKDSANRMPSSLFEWLRCSLFSRQNLERQLLQRNGPGFYAKEALSLDSAAKVRHKKRCMKLRHAPL